MRKAVLLLIVVVGCLLSQQQIPAPSAGGGTWGSITGTLSSQSDLNTALNAKLAAANNLSDLANAGTARTNLGLATVASSGSASDLGTGTISAGRLPNPSASSLGGVQSLASVSHNFLTSISTLGVPTQAQPACGDLSNSGTGCSGVALTTAGSFNEYQYRSNGTSLGAVTNSGPVPTASWVLHNCGSAQGRGNIDDFSAKQISLNVTGNTTANETCIATQSLGSAPYAAIFQVQINFANPTAASQAAGLYLYDGTKAYCICLLYNTSAQVEVATGQIATLASAYSFAGATQFLAGPQVTFKVVDDSTHRNWYYWSNGSFVLLLQETSLTFLTPTGVGIGAIDTIAAAANTQIQLLYYCVASGTTCNGQ